MALAAADGGVWSWGYNGSGQLGHGDRDEKVRAVRTCLSLAAALSQRASSLCSLLLL